MTDNDTVTNSSRVLVDNNNNTDIIPPIDSPPIAQVTTSPPPPFEKCNNIPQYIAPVSLDDDTSCSSTEVKGEETCAIPLKRRKP